MGEGGGTRERERGGRSCTEKPNLSTSIYMLKVQMFKKTGLKKKKKKRDTIAEFKIFDKSKVLWRIT